MDAIPQPHAPFRLRRTSLADVSALARVHVDAWRETYVGIAPEAYLRGLTYAVREERWEKAEREPPPGRAGFLAEVDGRVVGFAVGGPERDSDADYDGELYALYLLRAQQGKGLGRALFDAVAGHLRTLGLRRMLVWVIAANPSVGFYKHLGGVRVREKQASLGGLRPWNGATVSTSPRTPAPC